MRTQASHEAYTLIATNVAVDSDVGRASFGELLIATLLPMN